MLGLGFRHELSPVTEPGLAQKLLPDEERLGIRKGGSGPGPWTSARLPAEEKRGLALGMASG